jgi:hypothetical protein
METMQITIKTNGNSEFDVKLHNNGLDRKAA